MAADPLIEANNLRRAAGIPLGVAGDRQARERAEGETIPDFTSRRRWEAEVLERDGVRFSPELSALMGDGEEWSEPVELRISHGSLVHRTLGSDW